jgi:hypothetical protein
MLPTLVSLTCIIRPRTRQEASTGQVGSRAGVLDDDGDAAGQGFEHGPGVAGVAGDVDEGVGRGDQGGPPGRIDGGLDVQDVRRVGRFLQRGELAQHVFADLGQGHGQVGDDQRDVFGVDELGGVGLQDGVQGPVPGEVADEQQTVTLGPLRHGRGDVGMEDGRVHAGGDHRHPGRRIAVGGEAGQLQRRGHPEGVGGVEQRHFPGFRHGGEVPEGQVDPVAGFGDAAQTGGRDVDGDDHVGGLAAL